MWYMQLIVNNLRLFSYMSSLQFPPHCGIFSHVNILVWFNTEIIYIAPPNSFPKTWSKCSLLKMFENSWILRNKQKKKVGISSTRTLFGRLLNLIHNLIKCSWALLNSNNELHLKPLVILFHISFSNYPLFPIYYYFILCLEAV